MLTTAVSSTRPRWRPGLVAWALWALAILGHAAMLWLDHLLGQAGRPDLTQVLPLLPHYLVGVGAATMGALLASRRPAHPVGWLLLVFGLASAVSGVAAGSTYYLVATRPQDLAAAGAVALVASLSFYPAPVAMSLIMLLTPTGSLPSPRWRWLARTIVVAPVVTGLADVFSSHPLLDPAGPPLRSPLAVPALAGPLEVVGTAASAVIGLAALAAAASLVVRYRRARGIERQQLRWLALAVTTVVPVGVVVAIVADSDLSAWGTGVAVLSVQLAIYAAIVRYRLYDLDRIISRTLAYGLLTLLLGGGYALVVLGLGQLVGQDSSLVVAAATLAVAAVVRPARRHIQRAVDRRFNRRSHDAARTIQAFSEHLREQIDLETLTGELLTVVEETMQPTSVSLWLRPSAIAAQDQRRTDASPAHGQPVTVEAGRVVALPAPRLDRVVSQR
jgi:hypothetical protein